MAGSVTRQPTDPVADEEILYRNIQDGRRRYELQPDGTLHFSSEAFLEPEMEPSVDRADLCSHDPRHSQRDDSDGVTSLLASEVRAIRDVGQATKKGRLERVYDVDIRPEPFYDHPILGTNEAHARIFTTPKCRNDGEFSKLKRSLARLASNRGWMIEPAQLRPPAGNGQPNSTQLSNNGSQ